MACERDRVVEDALGGDEAVDPDAAQRDEVAHLDRRHALGHFVLELGGLVGRGQRALARRRRGVADGAVGAAPRAQAVRAAATRDRVLRHHRERHGCK